MNTSIVEDVKHQLKRVGGGSHLTVDQRNQLIVQGCHQVRGEGGAPTAGVVTRLQSQYILKLLDGCSAEDHIFTPNMTDGIYLFLQVFS